MSREMKYSGIPWIGDVPNTWEIRKVKDVFVRKNEKAHQENPVILSLSRAGVKIRDISTNEGQMAESYYDYNPVEPFDLLLNPMDLYSGANCSMSLVSGVISPAYVNLRAKDGISPRFYDYYFKTQYWSMAFFAHGKGISFDNRWTLGVDTLFRYNVPFPSILEQQKIASFLDSKCSEIDDMIALQEKIVEELKAYKQSVITEAVTKGLDPNVPMKESGIKWIKQIPQHWNAVTPKALFSLRKDKAKQGERQLTASQQYGIIYQDEYTEITGNKVVTVMKDFDILKQVEVGDFVISMRSFQGGLEYSTKSGSISSAYVMLIPNLTYVYPRFYRWLFKSMGYINALQSTSNMVRDGQAMRYSNFAQVSLYQVPINEQKDIADYLDKKCEEIDKILLVKQSKIKSLQEYKKSIIYEYVTGKKEVI